MMNSALSLLLALTGVVTALVVLANAVMSFQNNRHLAKAESDRVVLAAKAEAERVKAETDRLLLAAKADATEKHLDHQDDKVAEVHVLVNGRLSKTLDELDAARAANGELRRERDVALGKIEILERDLDAATRRPPARRTDPALPPHAP